MTLPQKLSPPPLPKGFFTSQEAEEAREKEKILMAAVFLYPECSNDCVFCCYSKKREVKETLKPEEYTLLLKEISELGVKTVFVPGMGEPFLRERGKFFLNFSRTANEYGMYVVVPSNLNPTPTAEFIRELHTLDVSVIGKLESMIPEVLTKLTQPKIPYDLVKVDEGHITKGLSLLMEAGFNAENRLGCGTCLNTLNAEEAENIFRFYRRNNIFPYMQDTAPFGKALENPWLWEGLNYSEIFERLKRIDREEFGFEWEMKGHYVAFDFSYPMVYIEYDGTIRYNNYFLVDMGKVKDDEEYKKGYLKEVVNSKFSSTLRKIHFPRGKDPDCCLSDHSKCKKILLKPEDGMIELTEEPNKYCIYHSHCE